MKDEFINLKDIVVKKLQKEVESLFRKCNK